MKPGTAFNQGDILVVPFPFSDLTSVRQRPVLVLSKKEYNEKCEDIVTCGITSNLKDAICSVLIDDSNLIEGKLPVKSRVKFDKLFTLDKSIVIKKVARINKVTFEKVKEGLFRLI
jgi:mRNA interferase MazF